MANPPNRTTWWLTRVLIPAVVMALGGAAAGVISLLSPSVEVVPPETVAAPVNAITVNPITTPAMLYASGVARPAQEVSIMPEVSGRITEVSDNLVPGGRLNRGDVIARIDSRDYRLALDTEESRVQQAELELALERGRGRAAEREWEILGDGRPADEAALALRQPHLAASEQALLAAKSSRDRAKLALERTTLRAPFDALVLSESVDVGQVIGASSSVATLVGTDRFHIEVSVPTTKLSAVELPSNGMPGSPATIEWETGDDDVVRHGAVVGLKGSIADDTRRATLLVGIDDPLGSTGLPLLPGAWVEVAISGAPVQDVLPIPRLAVYNGDTVWVATAENTLDSRLITIAWSDPDKVFATSGFEEGDRLITSGLSLPVRGMPVDVIDTVEVAADDSPDGAL